MIKSLGRRGFLAAASAGLAAPTIAAGHTVAIQEAADQIGGRAFADTTTFDLPFDRGCSWPAPMR